MRRERYQTHRRHHRGRTRHHSATPHTYSHHHTHVFTPFFFAHAHSARERPREARRHAPDALSGLGTAKDHTRAEPDRPGAGPELPGAPDATAPTWAARARPGPVWKCPSTRFAPSRGRPIGRRRRPERPEHAAHTAGCGAALRGRGRGRTGRPEPLYLRSRGVNSGSGWHDGLSGAGFEALWRPRTFRSARDPPLEVPARWARHPEGRETRLRPPCRPTGWAGGAAARWPQ